MMFEISNLCECSSISESAVALLNLIFTKELQHLILKMNSIMFLLNIEAINCEIVQFITEYYSLVVFKENKNLSKFMKIFRENTQISITKNASKILLCYLQSILQQILFSCNRRVSSCQVMKHYFERNYSACMFPPKSDYFPYIFLFFPNASKEVIYEVSIILNCCFNKILFYIKKICLKFTNFKKITEELVNCAISFIFPISFLDRFMNYNDKLVFNLYPFIKCIDSEFDSLESLILIVKAVQFVCSNLVIEGVLRIDNFICNVLNNEELFFLLRNIEFKFCRSFPRYYKQEENFVPYIQREEESEEEHEFCEEFELKRLELEDNNFVLDSEFKKNERKEHRNKMKEFSFSECEEEEEEEIQKRRNMQEDEIETWLIECLENPSERMREAILNLIS